MDEPIDNLADLVRDGEATPEQAERLARGLDARAEALWNAETRWLASLSESGPTVVGPDAVRFAQSVLEGLDKEPPARASLRTRRRAAVFSGICVVATAAVALMIQFNARHLGPTEQTQDGQNALSASVQELVNQIDRDRQSIAMFREGATTWLNPPPESTPPATQPHESPWSPNYQARLLLRHGPAQLVPADTGLYLEVNGLASWQYEFDADPIARVYWRRMPSFQWLIGQWQAIQNAMSLSGDEIINRYFGKTLAIVGPDPAPIPGQPLLLLSRVNADDGDRLVRQLGLLPQPAFGAFKVYCTRDSLVHVALGQGWMALATVNGLSYMGHVLSQPDGAPRLSDDSSFKYWMSKLPTGGAATFYATRPDIGQVDAATLLRKPGGGHIEYVGRSSQYAQLISLLGRSDGLAFGPLSGEKETAGAMTLNIHDLGPGPTAMLDRLLGPGRFEADLLPKIEAPLLLFVGPPPHRPLDGPSPLYPPLGLAIKMRDPSVAHDLDQLITRLARWTDAASSIAGLPPAELRQASYGANAYTVVQVGDELTSRLGWPGLGSTPLVFGRAGDWYVICTQEKFFQSIADSGKSPAQAGDWPSLAKLDRPVLSLVIRPEVVSQAVAVWYIRRRYDLNQGQPVPAPPGGQIELPLGRQMVMLSRVLSHYRAITLQLQAEDPDEVHGVLEIKNGDMTIGPRS